MQEEAEKDSKHKGRTPVPIDWIKVDKMLESHSDSVSIAEALNIHPDTVQDRVKKEYGMSFTEYAHSKKKLGKINIRLWQYQKAEAGDNTMLIWLGKQWLDQREKPRDEEDGQGSGSYSHEHILALQEILALKEKLRIFESSRPNVENTQSLPHTDSSGSECVVPAELGAADIATEPPPLLNRAKGKTAGNDDVFLPPFA